MSQPLQVKSEDISHLTPHQLVQLLSLLLKLEARRYGLPQTSLHVPEAITTPDGGLDGEVAWNQDPEPEGDWRIPCRRTGFQVKAGSLTPKKAGQEILRPAAKSKSATAPPELKERISQLLDSDGCYIQFLGREVVRIEKVEAEIRASLKAANRAYWKTAQIRVYDANAIAMWVNDYLSAVRWVYAALQKYIPTGIRAWDEIADREGFRGCSYVIPPYLGEKARELARGVGAPRSAVRLLGLPGLGKTRLIVEAFREGSALDEGGLLRDAMLYCDAAQSADGILEFVLGAVRSRDDLILVVDNCDFDLHKQLVTEIKRGQSQMRLITIDINPEERSQGDAKVVLEPSPLRSVVAGVLKESFPELSDIDRRRLETYARGFPQIAVMLAEQGRGKGFELAGLEDDQLIRKLLWGRDATNAQEEAALRACAVFTRIPFRKGDQNIDLFLATHVADVPVRSFIKAREKWKRRGLLEFRGDIAFVTPPPLAYYLAAEWWKGFSPSELNALLAGARECGLIEPLGDRLRRLDSVAEARDLVALLCGPDGPLSKPEALISSEGSQLFRSIVEVNPPAATEAIVRAFEGWTVEQLKLVGEGRRELVWALECLCFWDDCFPRAARVLMAFAAAENETWSNNATGQFLQLFHLHLPGTKAPLLERLPLIREAVMHEDAAYQALGLKAVGHALHCFHFSRTGGVERQGSRPPEPDYSPSYDETDEYQLACIDLLQEVLRGRPQDVAQIVEELSSNLRGLIRPGTIERLDCLFSEIVAGHDFDRRRLIEALHDFIAYDPLGRAFRTEIEVWLKLLRPAELKARLHMIVTNPPRHVEREEDGHWVDVGLEAALKMAEELAPQGTQWHEHLSDLLQGEQWYAYAFGTRLAQLEVEAGQFVEACLSTLKRVNSSANAALLAGFLSALPRTRFVDDTIDAMFASEQLRSSAMMVARSVRINSEDLARFVRLLDAGAIRVDDLLILRFGSVLKHLSEPEMADFLRSIASHAPLGVWVALELLQMYTLSVSERGPFALAMSREFLVQADILAFVESAGVEHDLYAWSKAIAELAEAGMLDDVSAGQIADRIATYFAASNDSYVREHWLGDALQALMGAAYPVVWPRIGSLLVCQDWQVAHQVSRLLHNRIGERSRWRLDGMPDDYLIDWCRRNSPVGPAFFAEVMPMWRETLGGVEWHPLARRIVDEFGSQEAIQKAINANCYTFSCSGSTVPHYSKILSLMKQIDRHPRSEVRQWAARSIKALEERISRERKSDAEDALLYEDV